MWIQPNEEWTPQLEWNAQWLTCSGLTEGCGNSEAWVGDAMVIRGRRNRVAALHVGAPWKGLARVQEYGTGQNPIIGCLEL